MLTHLLKTEKAVDISTEDYKHLLKNQEEMMSLMRTIITQQQSPIQNRNTHENGDKVKKEQNQSFELHVDQLMDGIRHSRSMNSILSIGIFICFEMRCKKSLRLS